MPENEIINDRYTLIDTVGTGGFSKVYLASDKITDNIVAIKILKPTIDENNEAYKNFQQEIKTATSLIHPNIIRIYDFGLTNNHPFVVMEYIKGHSLHDILKKRGLLPLLEVIDIFMQTLDALEVAHQNGIIHRDIKPHNILYKANGKIVLADFGTAYIKDATQKKVKGTIIGSPPYLPPERLKGMPANERSDIYSLGISIYELLTGNVPFLASSVQETCKLHLSEPFPDIRKRNITVPIEFKEIIEKCCMKDPNDRYKNVNEIKADLLKVANAYKSPKKESFFKRLFKRGKHD